MPGRSEEGAHLNRILVATDRSESADAAVRWAADMAERFESELIVLQVVVPEESGEGNGEAGQEGRIDSLQRYAEEIAGLRGRGRVVVDHDPARAIVQASEDLEVDVVVVGNIGMSGRKSFLLGNVPNRVSHNARCHVIIVNTSQPVVDGKRKGARSAGIPVMPHILEEVPESEGRLLGRAARIGRVLAKQGFAELFTAGRGQPADDETVRARARRLRGAMEELGPTFAKMGQILSTRPDLLPQPFIEELATLQDQVPPLTEEEVVKVMEEELGVPWEDVFESIDPEPMAAGTIAQVHRATLTGGERVVIKVQRPTARTDILQDLGLLELFAEKTQERSAFRQVIDLPTIIEHLSASLRRELDFRQEASNLERMHGVLASFSRLDAPRVFSEFSTDRLLTMEEIQGVPLREIPDGPARKDAARQLLESYYEQILAEGFFHADPHPGNMMWWNDRIYFLDLGMVGEIEPEERNLMLLLLMAFWRGDVNFLSDVVLMLAGEDQRADLDVEGFQAEVGALLDRTRGLSLKEMQLGPILQEITEMSIRHGVRLPASLALTGKALAQMQLATAQLDPSLDPLSVVGDFMMKGFVGRFRDRLDPKWLFYEAQKLRTRMVRLMEAVERLAGARPGPKLQVQFRGMEGLEDTVRRTGRRLAVGMVAAASLAGSAFAAASVHAPGWMAPTMGIGGLTLTAGLIFDLFRRRR